MKNKTLNFSLGKYELVETDDGSQTLLSTYFDENCHSTAGAWEETEYNYFYGCKLDEKLKTQNQLTVFETGFGIGAGLYVIIDKLGQTDFDGSLKFISCEMDEKLTLWALRESDLAKKYLTDASIGKEEYSGITVITCQIRNIKAYVIIGDIRETFNKVIPSIIDSNKIDAIFQDAFSPRKNPTLWTKEWFRNLRSYSNDKCVMSTYSSSIAIRKAMIAAGFFLINRKGFGNKRTCTQAITRSQLKDDDLHDQLSRSKTPALSDENYKVVLKFD
jgi:tRNA U34 5-methylaminomethyl-2-thiouridine-forming methyltransferase MnmC